MSKKNASIIAMVMLSVFFVFSLMPVLFTRSLCYEESYGVYVSNRNADLDVNLFYRMDSRGIGTFVLIFAGIGIVALILQFANKQSPFIKLISFAPLVTALLFFIYSAGVFLSRDEILGPRFDGSWGQCGYGKYTPAWGYFIATALIIAVAVLTILILSGKLINSEPVVGNNVVNSADELKRFKELYDEGIITQEEFEAKKKQLLGL